MQSNATFEVYLCFCSKQDYEQRCTLCSNASKIARSLEQCANELESVWKSLGQTQTNKYVAEARLLLSNCGPIRRPEEKQTHPNVLLTEVRRVLLEGGHVEFHWAICNPYLVYPTGNRMTLDGRSYQGFLQTMADVDGMRKTETGNMEAGDLVIKWEYR